MSERRYFSEDEARAKVGQRIRTLTEWSGVPVGTEGRVTRADPAGKGWDVAIQWDLRADPLQVATGQLDGEDLTIITGGKPLVDWFTRDEYERYLVEV